MKISIRPEKYTAIVKWNGTFEYRPSVTEERVNITTYEYNHLPTREEILNSFEVENAIIISRPDWSNIKIVGVSIVEPVIAIGEIIIKK